MSLADALDAAADALPAHEDAIRPANGDALRVLAALDPKGASELLRWLFETRPADGEELAQLWADEPSGIAAIVSLGDASLDKAGRKALRRVQHKLRSRGVELAATATPAHVATLPKLEDALEVALVSAPDPSGAQLVLIVEPAPAGGARIFQGVADLGRGILEFHVVQANRSQARRLVRDLAESEQLGAVAASRESLAALLARAAAVQPADRALPAAFGEWRSRIARPPADARTPGELARAALAEEPLPSLLREAAEAVAAGAIGPWPADFEALRQVAERVRDTAKSPLLVDEPQRRAQVDAVLADAAEAAFGGARAETVAARFEEAAYSAWKRGQADEARRWVATARSFREQPARDNPVARALLDRALAPLLQWLAQQEPGAGGSP